MRTIRCASAAEWETWLEDNHQQEDGVWLEIAKKGSGLPSVTPAEATTVALCYGWIDSLRRSHDDVRFLQRYSPRRRGSSWSRINVERAEALIAAGHMREAGLAEIEAARADGRWDAAVADEPAAGE